MQSFFDNSLIKTILKFNKEINDFQQNHYSKKWLKN